MLKKSCDSRAAKCDALSAKNVELAVQNKQLHMNIEQLSRPRSAGLFMKLEASLQNASELLLENKRLDSRVSQLQSRVDTTDAKVEDQGAQVASLQIDLALSVDAQEEAEKQLADVTSGYASTRKRLKEEKNYRKRDGSKFQKEAARFEQGFNAMLRRKKGDVGDVLKEISMLLASTEEVQGRTTEEQHKLIRALDAVQSELEGVTKRHADATDHIKTKKNGKEFDDNIVLLAMELQTLGVSSNIVGQVEVLCARHLAKRCALCSLHVYMYYLLFVLCSRSLLSSHGDQVSIYFSDHSLYSFLLITILTFSLFY